MLWDPLIAWRAGFVLVLELGLLCSFWLLAACCLCPIQAAYQEVRVRVSRWLARVCLLQLAHAGVLMLCQQALQAAFCGCMLIVVQSKRKPKTTAGRLEARTGGSTTISWLLPCTFAQPQNETDTSRTEPFLKRLKLMFALVVIEEQSGRFVEQCTAGECQPRLYLMLLEGCCCWVCCLVLLKCLDASLLCSAASATSSSSHSDASSASRQ